MKTNIFFRELKVHKKSLLFWCLGMFLMIWSGMEKYSGLKVSGDAANKMLEQFPSSVKRIIGLDGLDINTAVGFYGVLFIYLAIMAAIQAVLLGSSLVAKEERDKTVEFLLAKPVTRSSILTQKLLAGFVIVLLLNIFTFVVSLYSVANQNSGNPPVRIGALLMIGMLFIQLIFLSLGAYIGASSKRPKRAGTLASSLMMLTFVVYIFVGINDSLRPLRFLTPFKYFEGSQIINSDGLNTVYVILSLLLIAFFTIFTYYKFNKKDVSI